MFIGYDISIGILILGIEVQGFVGGRKSEISSNGVYANRSRDFSVRQFNFNGENVDEVNFAYIRQTIQIPYGFSLLPKVGFILHPGSFLYTKFGIKHENLEIVDHPETIDVLPQKNPKKYSDVIYNDNKTLFIGGMGIETPVTKRTFLRFEFLYSDGFSLTKGIDEFTKNGSTEDIRQLEELRIKSMKNISVGLGGGFRF
jgi:hypothetical protein